MRIPYLIISALTLLSLTTYKGSKNVLKLKSKPHFTESISCVRTYDNSFQIDIEVSYNLKHSVDEEYSHNLRLILPSTISQGSVFKISEEYSDVKCNYQFSSVWMWPEKERPNNMNGQVKVVGLTKNVLTLELNIKTTEKDAETNVVYKGERTVDPD